MYAIRSYYVLLGASNGLFVKNVLTNDLRQIYLEEEKDFRITIKDFITVDDHFIWIATSNGLYLFDVDLKKSVMKFDSEHTANSRLSDVITSYSIHYTKLYDGVLTNPTQP